MRELFNVSDNSGKAEGTDLCVELKDKDDHITS
jgi:hypothetical protein